MDFETLSLSSYHRTFGLYTKLLLQNFTLIVICDVSTYLSGFGLNIAFASLKKKVKISLFFNAWEDLE